MRIPIITMVMILHIIPSTTFSQETPSTETHQQTEPLNVAPDTPATPKQPAVEIPAPAEKPTAVTAAPEAKPAQTENVATPQPVEKPAMVAAPPAEKQTSVIPAEPQPIADEAIVIPAEPTIPEKNEGIDTVSLENPQGNWLFKRIWWERAEERYEKIRGLVDNIWTSRTDYFIKRSKLDREIIDPFYLNVGVGEGELQAKLSELIAFVEKHKEEHGDLNDQERMLLEALMTEEENLKNLLADVSTITNLDQAIDQALGTLMDQINRVRQFESDAWNNFKKIAHLLDDTKARELYYMIEGAARNIKNISTYLEQNFTRHFDTLISETTKHVARIQNQIEGLKEKGVNFKRQAENIEQQNQQNQLDQEDEDEEVAPKPKLSWMGWMMSQLNSVSNSILSIVKIPYNMIFGK